MRMHSRCVLFTGHWKWLVLVSLLSISFTGVSAGKKISDDTWPRNPPEGDTTKKLGTNIGWHELQALKPLNKNSLKSDLRVDEIKHRTGIERAGHKSMQLSVPLVGESSRAKYRIFKNEHTSHGTVRAFSLYELRTAWMYRNPARLKHRGRRYDSRERTGPGLSTNVLQSSDKLNVYFDNVDYTGEPSFVKRKLLTVPKSAKAKKDPATTTTATTGPEDKTVNTSADNSTGAQFWGKRRWRARQSEDAMWGLACTVFVVVLLIWGVWFSGMCKMNKERFVHLDYSTIQQSMSVREMLKNRARHLPIFRSQRKRQQLPDQVPLLEVDPTVEEEEDELFNQEWESIDIQSEERKT